MLRAAVGNRRGPLRAKGEACSWGRDGGEAPFQSFFGDQAKAAFLSKYLPLLARGHSAKPGMTQELATVGSKEWHRGLASRGRGAATCFPGTREEAVIIPTTGYLVVTRPGRDHLLVPSQPSVSTS